MATTHAAAAPPAALEDIDCEPRVVNFLTLKATTFSWRTDYMDSAQRMTDESNTLDFDAYNAMAEKMDAYLQEHVSSRGAEEKKDKLPIMFDLEYNGGQFDYHVLLVPPLASCTTNHHQPKSLDSRFKTLIVNMCRELNILSDVGCESLLHEGEVFLPGSLADRTM